MTLTDRQNATAPTPHPNGRNRRRRHLPDRLVRRTRFVAIAIAIGVVTVAVPPLVVPHVRGARPTQHAQPGPGLVPSRVPSPTPSDSRSSAPVPSQSPSAPTVEGNTLLSQGHPAIASSWEAPELSAPGAVDGNARTRWSSSSADPQWLQVDLDATATISSVVLQWDSAFATAYEIQTSTDGQTWSSIYRTTTSTGGTQTLQVSGHGRFVRMYGTARATQYGYSLWEFQVYGTRPAKQCETGGNAALNRPATASSVEAAEFDAAKAVDEDRNTRWSSEASDPQWIQVDLGSSQHICQVVLDWENAYATAYQIDISADARTWSTVYRTTTSTGGPQTLTVSGTGRYLRVYGSARGTRYGYSLWDLAIHTGR